MLLVDVKLIKILSVPSLCINFDPFFLSFFPFLALVCLHHRFVAFFIFQQIFFSSFAYSSLTYFGNVFKSESLLHRRRRKSELYSFSFLRLLYSFRFIFSFVRSFCFEKKSCMKFIGAYKYE